MSTPVSAGSPGHGGDPSPADPVASGTGPLPAPVFAPLPMPRAWWERVNTPVVIATVGFVLLLAVALVLPVPYALRTPGPTVDTLGERDGTPLITITDTETYPSEAELRLTTVSVAGGPGFPVDAARTLRAWFDPRASVLPAEAVFNPNQTREESEERSQAQMISSQEQATVAALTALGYQVPAVLHLAGTQEGGPAEGRLFEDDVITHLIVDGERIDTPGLEDLTAALATIPAGTEVEVWVDRAGVESDATVITGDDGSGGSVLGVLVDPEFSFPVDVDIEISNIGGSSAGTMFALGIMELLTPGDVAGDHVIAGTGTMDTEGNVGAIGGIVQKMNGALRDGASYFLAPADNCAEVVGHVPAGLQVIEIATLQEAWNALEAIGTGTADTLPTCTLAPATAG